MEQDPAATLPADWYGSIERLEIERRTIFAHCWQYIGAVEKVSRAGDFFTGLAGNVPIVVTRDEHEQLRAFVNVCRHRCAEVAKGCGNTKNLVCPYHGWVYGLDGRLRAAPRSKLERHFDTDQLDLVEASVATWGRSSSSTQTPMRRPSSSSTPC